MTSDAEEYREQHRFMVIRNSVSHLRNMQVALHRVFGEVVTTAQWSDFSRHSIKAYTNPQDWDMISNHPDQLGKSILQRQKEDVDHAAAVLGDVLLKHTGSTLMDIPVEDLRESPKKLGQVEMTLEQISELLGHNSQDKTVIAVTTLKKGVEDMINNNTTLSSKAAMSFGYKPMLADTEERRLRGKRQLLDVAQMWAELAMLETRVMRTALVLDMAFDQRGIEQDRSQTDYQGRVVLSTPTQTQFVVSDKQAFTGLGKAKQTLNMALVH